MRCGIDQGIDDLQLLDDRAGPPMRDDDGQRIFMLRTNVDKVEVEPIDRGDKLRQRVQLRFDLAPVVLRSPVACERLDHRERDALRLIIHCFLVGPPGREHALAKVIECSLRDVDAEWPDGRLLSRCESGGTTLASASIAKAARSFADAGLWC